MLKSVAYLFALVKSVLEWEGIFLFQFFPVSFVCGDEDGFPPAKDCRGWLNDLRVWLYLPFACLLHPGWWDCCLQKEGKGC